jgi:hypothetical protein
MKVIYSILVCLVLVVAGGATYLYMNLDSFMSNQEVVAVDEPLVKVPKGTGNELKIISPFYLRDASDAYKELNKMVNAHVTVTADMNSLAQKQLRAPVYSELISFYEDTTHAPKERAYALNLVNLIFILGFDAQTFREGIAGHEEFAASFDKHLAYAKSLKKKTGGSPGAMFGLGDPAMNYAAQKTMAEINRAARELYPSSYALLRGNLNEVQSEWILYTNHENGKVYKAAGDILVDKLGASYFDDTQQLINDHVAAGTMYEDTYASSPEINIMYAQGFLWTRYQMIAGNKALEKEARRILDESLTYHDKMVTSTDEYNTGRLFYGYVLSAMGKSRIAGTGLYTKEESEQLLKQAEDTFIKITRTSKNKQLPFWLKNLPKSGWMRTELDNLTKRNSIIQGYVQSL